MYPHPFKTVYVSGSNPRWIDEPELPNEPGIPSAYAYREWLDSVENVRFMV